MSTSYQARPVVDPVIYPETAAFWQAANEGQLLLKRCTQCTKVHWFPRSICPFCGSDRTEWTKASGRGNIYSVSVMRAAVPVAYALAYVTLVEGVTMMTNIVDCDLDALRIGDEVEVVFKPSSSGQWVPMFRPIQGHDGSQARQALTGIHVRQLAPSGSSPVSAVDRETTSHI